MLRLIIAKEITESLLNRRFLVIAAFSVVLLVISGVVNYEYYQARQASFDSQYASFTRDKSNDDVRAYRPPELLSVLARGTEPYMPLYFDFGTSEQTLGQVDVGNIEAEDFRLLASLGSLDFLFLVQVVFSLLAILLSFDMIAGEKERGTLRAVLANSVPRDKVILGKAIGGFLVLLIVFLIGALLLFAILSAMDGRFLRADTLVRFLAVIGFSAVYIAGFFMIGLMISSLCHTGRTAIVSLLVVWVTLLLVIPKLAEATATLALPVRSEESLRVEKTTLIAELDQRKMDESGKIYEEIFQTDRLNSSLISQETPEAEQFREAYQKMNEGIASEAATRLREIDEGFERERRSQRRLSYALAILSPTSAHGFLVSDLAGTGDIAFENFQDNASDYYARLRSGPLAAVTSQSVRVRIGGSSVWMNIGDEFDWDSIPTFQATEIDLPRILRRNTWALVSLGLFVLIPFLLAYVSFIRYDVR
jgi:ABC-type transport system involved in multi-copper enzyme maturation permease subunit